MQKNNNTYTITGKELGRTTITFKSSTKTITLDVVVADKVLDVPLIRQEQSQWCWAACAQMVVKKYRPNDSHSQTDMARIGQQLDEDQMPSDDDNNYHAIERIVSNCTDNTVSLIHKTDSNFTENDLRTQLNAGSPVIYLSSRYSNSGTRTGGHLCRILLRHAVRV